MGPISASVFALVLIRAIITIYMGIHDFIRRLLAKEVLKLVLLCFDYLKYGRSCFFNSSYGTAGVYLLRIFIRFPDMVQLYWKSIMCFMIRCYNYSIWFFNWIIQPEQY